MLDTPEALRRFVDENRDVEWMAFDTEFIGEKRYFTLLCLIQVATENGYYFIDPIAIENLDGFIDLLENPNICKITHAGENDYRLMYQEFECIPKNVFDTQVAAGFVGYPYPISFRGIVEGETGIHIAKGFAVTDWERRPLQPKQLKYALEDVLYLREIQQSLLQKLEASNRLDWAQTEFAVWETPDYYYRDPYADVFKGQLINRLKTQDQVFLLRLHDWRRGEAERRNHSKEMVLQSKLIAPIVRAVPQGLKSMRNNRRLSDRLVDRHGKTFLGLYEDPPSPRELEVLERVPPRRAEEDPRYELMTEMLYLMVSYKCMEEDMAISIVLPRGVLKDMKADRDQKLPPELQSGWRRHFLGDDLVNWMENRDRLKLQFTDGKMELQVV